MGVSAPHDAKSVRIRLGGACVDVATLSTVLESTARRLRGGHPPLYLASANLNHIRHYGFGTGRERVFEDHRTVDWLVLLDGMPLVWAARRLTGLPVPLLAGSDLLESMLLRAAEQRARIGVLGGTPSMHQSFDARVSSEMPTLRVAGYWAPHRGELESPAGCRALADDVRDAGVDLLIVSLGKPRQEEFLLRYGTGTGASVAVAFGAAADFFAGTVRRAPSYIRGSGVEWLYRLALEPRRLARRYLLEGPLDTARLLLDSGLWLPTEVHAGFDSLDLVNVSLPRQRQPWPTELQPAEAAVSEQRSLLPLVANGTRDLTDVVVR